MLMLAFVFNKLQPNTDTVDLDWTWLSNATVRLLGTIWLWIAEHFSSEQIGTFVLTSTEFSYV